MLRFVFCSASDMERLLFCSSVCTSSVSLSAAAPVSPMRAPSCCDSVSTFDSSREAGSRAASAAKRVDSRSSRRTPSSKNSVAAISTASSPMTIQPMMLMPLR